LARGRGRILKESEYTIAGGHFAQLRGHWAHVLGVLDLAATDLLWIEQHARGAQLSLF